MLSFFQPLAALGFLSLLPIILWYFLRQRFKQQAVGSLFLWKQVEAFQDKASRVAWRSILLLLLQIAAVSFLVLALMQPVWIEERPSAPGVLVVIDDSASMQTIPVKTIIEAIDRALSPNGQAGSTDQAPGTAAGDRAAPSKSGTAAGDRAAPSESGTAAGDRAAPSESGTAAGDRAASSVVAGPTPAGLRVVLASDGLSVLADFSPRDMEPEGHARRMAELEVALNNHRSKPDALGLSRGFETERVIAELSALLEESDRPATGLQASGPWAGLIVCDAQDRVFVGALPRLFGKSYRIEQLQPEMQQARIATFSLTDEGISYRLVRPRNEVLELRLLYWPGSEPALALERLRQSGERGGGQGSDQSGVRGEQKDEQGDRATLGLFQQNSSDNNSTSTALPSLQTQPLVIEQAVEVLRWSHGSTDPLMGIVAVPKINKGLYALQVSPTGRDFESTVAFGQLRLFALNPPTPVRILLVGPPSPFLQAALLLNNLELDRVDRITYQVNTALYDLVIANQQVVPENLQAHVVSFGIPISDVKLRVLGKASSTLSGAVALDARGAKLNRFLDWSGVAVRDALLFDDVAGLSVLARAASRAAVVAWESEGYKRLNLGFDLFSSDLGFSSVFPAFVQNVLSWVVPEWNNPLAYHFDSQTYRASRLDSKLRGPWNSLDGGASRAALADSLGFVFWTVVSPPPEESSLPVEVIQPAPPSDRSLASMLRALPGRNASELHELWGLFLLLAGAFLLVEWLVWYGVDRPKRKHS